MNKKINPRKAQEVERVKSLVKKYRCLGMIDIEGLPSAQLQKMRSQLKSSVLITMSKKRLIKLALEQLKADKQNLEAVESSIKGLPALLFTNDDPFKIYRLIQKSKSPAAARPGQISPKDIVIPAGPTPFTPGPIIGELGQLGIKTEVKEGKVCLKEDNVLVKESQVISDKVASLLSKLNIQPMEIGLNIISIYENGMIYKKDALSIDEATVINEIKQVSLEAMALAMELGFIDKDTISPLLSKAYRQAIALEAKTNVNGG